MKMAGNIRYLSLITVFAFLLNAMLPFVTTYNVPDAEQAELSSLFGDKILICTASGFKLVSFAELNSGDDQHQPDDSYQCALCVVQASGNDDVTLLAVAVTYVPLSENITSGFFIASDVGRSQFYGIPHSRAPPYMV